MDAPLLQKVRIGFAALMYLLAIALLGVGVKGLFVSSPRTIVFGIRGQSGNAIQAYTGLVADTSRAVLVIGLKALIYEWRRMVLLTANQS